MLMLMKMQMERLSGYWYYNQWTSGLCICVCVTINMNVDGNANVTCEQVFMAAPSFCDLNIQMYVTHHRII